MVLTPKVLVGKNINFKSYATENDDIHVENITLLRKKYEFFCRQSETIEVYRLGDSRRIQRVEYKSLTKYFLTITEHTCNQNYYTYKNGYIQFEIL